MKLLPPTGGKPQQQLDLQKSSTNPYWGGRSQETAGGKVQYASMGQAKQSGLLGENHANKPTNMLGVATDHN